MSFRDYTLSDHDGLRTTMEQLDINESTLLQMARESAPFMDAIWNRRFEQYVLRIEGNLIMAIGLAGSERRRTRVRKQGWAKQCTICRGVARLITYEPCNVCNARGCARCGDGKLTVETICPMAREGKTIPCSRVLEEAAKR